MHCQYWSKTKLFGLKIETKSTKFHCINLRMQSLFIGSLHLPVRILGRATAYMCLACKAETKHTQHMHHIAYEVISSFVFVAKSAENSTICESKTNFCIFLPILTYQRVNFTLAPPKQIQWTCKKLNIRWFMPIFIGGLEIFPILQPKWNILTRFPSFFVPFW